MLCTSWNRLGSRMQMNHTSWNNFSFQCCLFLTKSNLMCSCMFSWVWIGPESMFKQKVIFQRAMKENISSSRCTTLVFWTFVTAHLVIHIFLFFLNLSVILRLGLGKFEMDLRSLLLLYCYISLYLIYFIWSVLSIKLSFKGQFCSLSPSKDLN